MRVRLLIAYDGAAFSGFARNLDVVSVAETLESMIGAICGTPVTMTGAGRTDKGVHAHGQVVTFDAPDTVDLGVIQRSVAQRTGGDIVIRDAEIVDESFDARFSARWRRYRYTVVNRPLPEISLRSTSWHMVEPLSLAAMRQGAIPFVGLHDFSSFCRRPKRDDGTEVPLIRTVLSADWAEIGHGVLRFEITATAFCHQMVRSIVGTLVDVGRGHLTAGSIAAIIASRDRQRAGQLAPSHGLSLHEVGYGSNDRYLPTAERPR